MVVLEFSIAFVDCIVGKMHEEVAKILPFGRTVSWVSTLIRSVANRASPSRYTYTLNGSHPATSTYTLRSNFSPYIKRGFRTYF